MFKRESPAVATSQVGDPWPLTTSAPARSRRIVSTASRRSMSLGGLTISLLELLRADQALPDQHGNGAAGSKGELSTRGDGRAGERRLIHAVHDDARLDRKSTRLNSSHLVISYAVFCLHKKNSIVRCRPPAL